MSAVTNPAADTVEEIIKNNKVVVFSKILSVDCKKAKVLLTSLNANAYVMELNHEENKDAILQYLQYKTNQFAVPFIFIKEKFIGGFDDLLYAYECHQLQKWLE